MSDVNRSSELNSRATRGFAWNHLYKIVEYGLLNLYTILVVRHFGPELAAPYSVFLSLCTTLAMVSAFSVDGVLLRFMPRVSASVEDADSLDPLKLGVIGFTERMLAFRLFVTTILGVIVIFGLNILPLLRPSIQENIGSLSAISPFLVAFLLLQACASFATFTLIGLLKVKWVFVASLISRSLLLAAGIALVFVGHLDLLNSTAVYVAAAGINAVFLLYWLRHELRTRTDISVNSGSFVRRVAKEYLSFLFKPRRVKALLALPVMIYGITTWGSDILSTVLGRQPDVLMLRAMLGEHAAQISYYQVASLIALMAEYVFLFGFSGTLVSVFSSLVHQDEADGAGYPRLAKARSELSGFQTVTTFPLFTFVFCLAPAIVRALFGPQFSDSVPLVRVAMIVTALTVALFGGGMSITSLVVIGKERLVFRNRLAWGLCNLIANVFLIRYFGAFGAIVGTQLANAVACASESYFARKLIGAAMHYGNYGRIIFSSVAASAVGLVVSTSLEGTMPMVLVVAVAGMVTASLTLAGYLLLRVPEVFVILRRIESMLGSRGSRIIQPLIRQEALR